MDDILNIQEDNLGGLQLVQFAPPRFFTSLSPVTFKPGLDWINVYCTQETMQFTEASSDDDNCGSILVTIAGTVPKLRADVGAILQKYRLQRMIVKTQDMNGLTRLAGTLDSALLFTDQADSGTAVADPNQYTLNFSAPQAQAAAFL